MEQRKPLHRVAGRAALGQGARRSQSRGRASEERGLRLRQGVHLGAAPRDKDALVRARGNRPDVDTGREIMEAQRAPLRRAPGAQQGRDRGEIRRRAGQNLAPQLRDAPAAP